MQLTLALAFISSSVSYCSHTNTAATTPAPPVPASVCYVLVSTHRNAWERENIKKWCLLFLDFQLLRGLLHAEPNGPGMLVILIQENRPSVRFSSQTGRQSVTLNQGLARVYAEHWFMMNVRPRSTTQPLFLPHQCLHKGNKHRLEL